MAARKPDKEGQIIKEAVKRQQLAGNKVVNKKKHPSPSRESNASEKASDNQSEFCLGEMSKNVQKVPKS
jgi:hypothetical protein